MTTSHTPWSPESARALLMEIDEPGPVLVALQTLQAAFGYVHSDSIPIVADVFNVSRAEVYGVLTFYSDLRTTPPLDVEVRICMGEACQAVGARSLRADADALIGPSCDVQNVFCLGNCALGPAAVVNDRMIGRADASTLRDAVMATGAGA
jgi:formate dehydrogenase subunit gamma